MILIVKHIGIEGMGTLGRFLKSARKRVKTMELWKGSKLPEDFADVEAIIALGGPMNVYEEDRYPFLKKEDIFLKTALKRNIPVLGICLGAQLLAKAAGAKVKKATQGEIGWHEIILTREGSEDRIFSGLKDILKVFQWHEDTFEVPRGGILLATSDKCTNQAFRVGTNAYGLQFHIEITEAMIISWVNKYSSTSDDKLREKREEMVLEYKRIKDDFDINARKLCLNFLNIVEGIKTVP